MAMSLGLEPKVLKAALEGVMPWLTPTDLASEALEKLDRPLLAWMQDPKVHMFDSAAHYAEYADEPGGLSRLEREIAKLSPRPEWEMERVWSPDEETDEAYDAAYEEACVTIGGHRLHPRDLDAYTSIAYELADLADQDEEFDPNDVESKDDLVRGDLDAGLGWAAAGVCVLQQSLPYPFRDVLPYGCLDNRPAHRLVYAYASLLQLKHPRKAAVWFTAMVYFSPMDNMGARFLAPGGPSSGI
ncbi:hypothetical protein [Streptomyces doebereineriae]|uniref:Uncharacterized protein n=1 Tax=Streptomyces doebereineriae TaxID=3075528 RepID=A0ABU2VI25_9ACTN|nr:hypothetical protein [Streptomyces sp. DSM 41640]MDT0485240.1 hypothetical protein [Streptomyces sp. DSM 41640]